MKALIRSFDGKQYTWETVKYYDEDFHVRDQRILGSEIVSIVNDNRKNYMKCSSCGRLFRKGSPHFEEHQRESKTAFPCMSCQYLNVCKRHSSNSKYIANPDGTFTEKTKATVRLECNRFGVWSHPDIMSKEATNRCKKRACDRARLIEIHDIFTDYPGVFDEIITSDAIEKVGYKEKIDYGNECEYKLNGKNKIVSYVNKYGIVDCFCVHYYDECWTVFYSKKYDKLFTTGYSGGYVEFNPLEMTTESYNNIKRKIAELYN